MRIPALAIFAIAFAVRLVHVLQIRSAPFFSVLMGDSRGYDEWARRIAAGDWWGHEVFYQAPLYPYFLGVVYAAAGRHLLLVRIVQAAIGSASCALVALAAARLVSRRTGIAAGLILALYAPAIFFDGLLQKSTLDVFFVSLCLWLIALITTIDAEHAEIAEKGKKPLRVQRVLRATSWPWVALGLTLGGLSLTRENAVVFIIVILAWAILSRNSLRPSRPVRSLGMFLAGLAIVIVPVAARNSLVGGGFYVTTSQFGPNFYIGNHAKADGTYASLRYGRGAPEYERQDAAELAELALGRKLSPGEVSGYWTDRALQFITSQPGAWLELMARKVALVWNHAEMVDTEDQATHAEWSLPLRVAGPVAHFGVLVPLAVFGIIVTWPMRARLWVLLAMLLAYAASVALFYVFARYRYPLVPLLVVFAGAGLVEAPAWIRARIKGAKPVSSVEEIPFRALRGRAVWTAVAVGATAVVANWPFLSTDLMRAVTENNIAVALQAEQRLDEADAHYRRAIQFRSDYAPAYSTLGTALRARGQLSEAIDAYQQALRLQPEYPDAHYNLANALLDSGQSASAIQHFQIALRSVPGSAEVHNNLGIALASHGKRDEALAEFDAAARIDPGSAKAQRNLGDALLAVGRGREALDRFKRAVELAPDEGSLHYDYGSVLLEAGRPEEAVTELRAALKTMPNAPEVHNNLGIALGSSGKLQEAIEEFQTALRIKPDFKDARRNLEMALRARTGQRAKG